MCIDIRDSHCLKSNSKIYVLISETFFAMPHITTVEIVLQKTTHFKSFYMHVDIHKEKKSLCDLHVQIKGLYNSYWKQMTQNVFYLY